VHCRRTADVSVGWLHEEALRSKLNLSSELEIPVRPGTDLAFVLQSEMKEVT
jgi:hypothetical protein